VAAIFIVIANSVNLLSKTEYDIAGLFNNTSNQNHNDQLIIIEDKPEEINRVKYRDSFRI